MKAIDRDIAVGHHSVKVDEDSSALIFIGQTEMLAIPAYARGEIRARAAGGVGLVEWPFDAPVMRDRNGSPGGIVKGRGIGTGCVGFKEPPIGIEGEGCSRALGSL